MTAYQFAVLRYMPDAVRQETVNVGVVVAIPNSGRAEVRTLKKADATRLTWLGAKDDMGFLQDVADDLAHPAPPSGAATAADALAWARMEWGGTIQVSELHAALHDDPADLCDELYNQYVANPRKRRPPAYRDRSAVRRTVKAALLANNFPQEAIRPHAEVPGRYEPHKFDLGLANGRLLHVIATMSFEAPPGEPFQTEIDAWAFAITDVRHVDSTLPISVVTIGTGPRLDGAAVMYEALGARLIREPHIEDWSRGVASELGSKLQSAER